MNTNGSIKVSYMRLRDVPFVVRRYLDLLRLASNLVCSVNSTL